MADEITVTRVDRAPAAELQESVNGLLECGYELAGSFVIREIPGVEVVGLANAQTQTYAAVGRHESGLSWVDVVMEFDDGRWLTVSNNATAGALGTMPGHDKVFLEARSTGAALHRRAAQEPTEGRRSVSPGGFADAMQRSYASEAAARRKSGVSLDDLRRVSSSEAVSDELATTQAILEAQRALETLQQAVQSGDNPLAAFGEVMEALSQGTLADPEDDPATVALAEALGITAGELADRAVVISADLDEDDLVWTWDSAMEMAVIPVSASQPVMHALITGELEGDPIELAAAANARLPERYRLRVTARVTEPVVAVAYQPIARAVPADPRPDETRIAETFTRWRGAVKDADLPPSQLQCGVERGLPTASIAVPGTEAVRAWEALRERAAGAGFWPVIRGAGPIPSAPEDGPGASTWLEHAQLLKTDDWLRRAADIDSALRDEEDDEDYEEDLGDVVEPTHELTIPLDIMTGEPLPTVIISLVPTNRSWEVPAYLHFGGFSDCPPPEVLVAMLKRWHEGFGAELVGMTNDAMELRVTRPVRELADAEPIAREQYLVCNDIVDQGTETVLRLARQCVGSSTWYFWWD